MDRETLQSLAVAFAGEWVFRQPVDGVQERVEREVWASMELVAVRGCWGPRGRTTVWLLMLHILYRQIRGE
jgi:hypothetical protein